MSAPPGWHPQPDGRDRWWDGQQWTEHFRDTEQPTSTYETSTQYGQDPYGQQSYGQGGYGQQPPPKQGMSKGLKGCLITGLVVVLVLAVLAVAAVVWFGRTVNQSVQDVQESIGNLPTDIPEGQGETIVIVVGEGFDVGGASVSDGWTLEDTGAGIGQNVEGMTAEFDESQSLPLLFTMGFGEDASAETVCTAVPPDGGGSSDVSCVPVFGDVDPDGPVTVTTAY
ncbi:DUF2510 domain-containing protein [Phycicoccus sp. BSK3Z-2]|uniref:DUF2510 domain-containing protein n=1 Tax=Phycicoccus avicenniae TaxID=2828860 RepID=A0A941DDF5_9MICO|nr:DUF2510 domain-containing protein [Phycicoccus avicenniae]MBR7744297.1 DUF2510 domain-containing protein [Phycicoccus avicenniae]